MDLKLKAIKDLFAKHNINPKDLLSEEKLAEAKLETGEVIVTEGEWAVGVVAMLQTEEGTMNLPEGAYILDDGTPFTVDAEGVVLTWGVEEEEMSEPLTKEVVEAMIKSAVATMTEEFKSIQAKAQEKAEKATSELEKELEAQLSKASAESSKKPRKVVIQKDITKMSKKERVLHAYNSRVK